MEPTQPTTLSIPSIVAFALISFLAIRYFFFAAPASASSSATSSSGRRVPPDRIEQVVVMFPQLSRRDIEWDLLRNGGSVQATSERVLREGRLPAPPPNFRASSPPSSAQPSTANSSSSSTSSQPKSTHPDLITKYNLNSRIGREDVQENEGKGKGKQAWSQNKSEREQLLKKRRDEMILQARRKMEEREKGKGKERAV